MECFSETWDARFLDLARLVGSWSKDPGTRVGAVIVRPDKTIAACGYNGPPRNTADHHQLLTNRAEKLRRTVHAEVNAVLTAHGRVDGCTLYVTPLYPCASCAGVIVQSGIARVVAQMAKEPPATWAEEFKTAAHMFKEAGVEVTLITSESK